MPFFSKCLGILSSLQVAEGTVLSAANPRYQVEECVIFWWLLGKTNFKLLNVPFWEGGKSINFVSKWACNVQTLPQNEWVNRISISKRFPN